MQHQIEGFTGHLRKSIDWGRGLPVAPPQREIRHVVVSGQGSAGMAAHLAQSLVAHELQIPFVIADTYGIPAFVNRHTLFVAVSPSGNTEETLAAAEKAIARDAKVVCLTAGGKLAQMAREKDLTLVGLPAASPGDFRVEAVVGLLFLLHGYGLTGNAFAAQMEKAIRLIDDREEPIREGAKDLANAIAGRLPILYADRPLYPVLLHFRQQINLVARQLAHVNVFPAMNHDELAGWVHPPALVDQAVIVQVQTTFDHPRVKARMDICRPVFAPKADKVVEILVRFGDSLPEQCLYLLHLFDWAAFYLAGLNGVDPGRPEVLDYLEGELAKV